MGGENNDTHLAFANDIIFFIRASEKAFWSMKSILEEFLGSLNLWSMKERVL